MDDAFSTAELQEPASYGRFLQAQAAAHLPTEAALAAGGVATIVPDWHRRQRGDLLRADLVALGLDVPAPAGTLVVDGEAAVLGALYVLEGSRLGGTMLKRSVARGLPTGFLGGVDSAAWRNLLVLLDERLDSDVKRAMAIEAASDVFDLFETAAHLYLGNRSIG